MAFALGTCVKWFENQISKMMMVMMIMIMIIMMIRMMMVMMRMMMIRMMMMVIKQESYWKKRIA